MVSGQAEEADLALRDQLRHGAGSLLDGRARVDAVLVVQIDMVGAQPGQRAFDGGPSAFSAGTDTEMEIRVLTWADGDIGQDSQSPCVHIRARSEPPVRLCVT
jgi:hypothetical protein